MVKLHWTSFVLCLVVILTACSQANAPAEDVSVKTPTWQEQYDLGVRYLSEGNYEEAIIAFTVAIEIDPKQAAAYIGRGDAYIGSGETENNLAAAQADYEKVIELNETIAEAYLGMAKIYIFQGKHELALGILQKGKEICNDNSEIENVILEVKTKILDETILSKDREILDQLFLCLSSEDFYNLHAYKSELLDKGIRWVHGPEFTGALESWMIGLCYDGTNIGYSLSGRGLKLCSKVIADFKPMWFLYYGDLKDGIAQGNGVGFHDYANGYYTFSGEWNNDLPNGNGIMEQVGENGSENGFRLSKSGNWIEGVLDGEVVEIKTEEGTQHSFHFTCSMGDIVIDNRWKRRGKNDERVYYDLEEDEGERKKIHSPDSDIMHPYSWYY